MRRVTEKFLKEVIVLVICIVLIVACFIDRGCRLKQTVKQIEAVQVQTDALRSEMNQRDEYLSSVVSGLNTAMRETLITVFDTDSRLDREFKELRAKVPDTFNLSVLDSCGIITNGQGHGSCVAVRPNIMLTAGHCIDIDGTWIEVNGRQYKILKQWKDEQYDVGFVMIDGELPFVELAGRNPVLLDEVFLVGSPYDTLLERTITKGIISHLKRDIYDHIGLIQTDAEGAPGSSGCPLFCVQGRIVGICVAGPQPGGGVTLCVPVEQIKEALNRFVQGNDPI